MLNVDVSFLFMRAAYHFAVIFLCFAIIIKYTMTCDSLEVRLSSRLNLALESMLQVETLSDKTWCRGTKTTF